MRITSDPPLPPSGLTAAAVVFICDLSRTVSGNVASESQEKRITMHRLDIDASGAHVTALPHTSGCPVVLSSAEPSVKGLFRSLAHGQWKVAGGQALGLLGPKPLYAARYLDQGGGGLSEDFSDFQFALPAKMSAITTSTGGASPSGYGFDYQAKVVVTDLGGEAVKGARITFSTPDGSVAQSKVLTGADGVAQVVWYRQAPGASSTITASGRGVAGADNNGPRPGIDPFQPIQGFFDGVSTGGGVPVLTGTQTLSGPAATSAAGPVNVFSYNFVPLGFTAPPSGSLNGLACSSASGAPTMGGVSGPRAPLRVTSQTFQTPWQGTLTVSMQLDNDAQLWLDGTNVTRFGQAPYGSGALDTGSPAVTTDDWWSRDFCAKTVAPVFTLPNVAAGSHVFAIYVDGRTSTTFAIATGSLAP